MIDFKYLTVGGTGLEPATPAMGTQCSTSPSPLAPHKMPSNQLLAQLTTFR
jgi:hypothetical protein